MASDPRVAVEVADLLQTADCVRTGRFTLKSGATSPLYLDLRRLVSRPRGLARVATVLGGVLSELEFDCLAGLPYAALPIATAISLQSGWPLVYPRKEAKAYGTQASVEGVFAEGDVATIVDDVATTAGTKLEALETLTAAGLVVRDVVVLVDRQAGAAEALAAHGLSLHAAARLSELLDVWCERGVLTPAQRDEVLTAP